MPTLPRPLLLICAVIATALAVAGGMPAASAQELPAWRHTSVNDFAALLTPDDTRIIDQALIALNRDTGVQGTIVTLADRAQYGSDGLEAFATRLFNDWGVGDRDRNDGFMILVLPGERAARIELGRGYPASADIRAQDVMSRVMLPAFRQGDLSRGTRDGTLAVIDSIARPHAAGLPVAGDGGGGAVSPFVIFASVAGGIAVLSLLRRRRRDRCPKCGHQGLDHVDGDPLRQARRDGGWITSTREITDRCPACGWQRQRTAPLPVVSYYGADGHLERTQARSRGGGSSGFGGGSSSGGGASGRW